VYPVSWASFVLGRPARVLASGNLAPSGVDVQATMILDSGRGAQALVSAGLNARTPSDSIIAGGGGYLKIRSPFWFADELQLFDETSTLVGSWTDPFDRPIRQSLCYQASALARYVADGLTDSPLHPLAEAVEVMETLDEVRRQIG
ncbi:MAG: oxidoreductase, partial [Frondihabitans sp.]|nr:oxidoreductase [Frondihabitans sp.]